MAYDQDKLLEIFGSEELTNLFNELEPEIADVIINQSFRKSAKVLIEKINASAAGLDLSNKKGHLHTLSTAASSSLKKSERTMEVGDRGSLGGYLAQIFDKGTTQRFTKSGRATGRIKRTDFFANAVRDSEQEIKDIISQDLTDRLNKIIQKRNKVK